MFKILLVALLTVLASRAALAQSTITITSPGEGDIISAEVPVFTIHASHAGTIVHPIVYEYTTNAGETWLMIDSIPGTGDPYIATYYWQDVPDIDEQVRIRIRDGNGVTGISGTFSLVSPAKPTRLEINHSSYPVPKDREVLIEWDMNHDGEVIELWYSQGIGSVPILSSPLPGDARTYVWRTPPFDLPAVTLTVVVDGNKSLRIGPFAIGEPAAVASRQESDLFISPNPASSDLTIEGLPANVQRISLIDASGRSVAEWRASDKLDVRGLPNGSYRLLIEVSDKVISHPLIISR